MIHQRELAHGPTLPNGRKPTKSLALVSTFVPPSASVISLAMGIAAGVVLPRDEAPKQQQHRRDSH